MLPRQLTALLRGVCLETTPRLHRLFIFDSVAGASKKQRLLPRRKRGEGGECSHSARVFNAAEGEVHLAVMEVCVFSLPPSVSLVSWPTPLPFALWAVHVRSKSLAAWVRACVSWLRCVVCSSFPYLFTESCFAGTTHAKQSCCSCEYPLCACAVDGCFPSSFCSGAVSFFFADFAWMPAEALVVCACVFVMAHLFFCPRISLRSRPWFSQLCTV